MRVAVVQEFGTPGKLELTDQPDPVPDEGEVVIDVEAAGVGGVDRFIRSGEAAAFGFTPGYVPGGEVAGTVRILGPGVDESWAGRRVWAFLGLGGGYASMAKATVQWLVPLPDGLSAEDAVTVGSSGVVARFALRQARLVAGESVLVRGAAGGLGVQAVQLAAAAGAATIGVTTSSSERGLRLRDLGATDVLDRDAASWSGQFDVVIDVIAGAGMGDALASLAPNGRLVAVGALGGAPPDDLAGQLFARFRDSLTLSTFSSDTVPVARRRAAVAELFDATVDGTLRSVVHATLPLSRVAEAHRMLDSGEVFGRPVLTVRHTPAAGH